MKLANYWAREFAQLEVDGKTFEISCWRSSNQSQLDAEANAREAAQQAATRFMQGNIQKYAYSDQALREEIIDEIQDRSGETIAAITRNTYGALVLNTARIMFVDIDDVPTPQKQSFLQSLFGSKKKPIESNLIPNRLDRWSHHHPNWGFRMYKTFKGFRLLVTHALFDPVAEETKRDLQALGSDPLYITLCRAQACFRARLTPKPWRMAMEVPSRCWQFPRQTPERDTQYQDWLNQYNTHSTRYATCKLVRHIGNKKIYSGIQDIINLHDQYSKATASDDLA